MRSVALSMARTTSVAVGRAAADSPCASLPAKRRADRRQSADCRSATATRCSVADPVALGMTPDAAVRREAELAISSTSAGRTTTDGPRPVSRSTRWIRTCRSGVRRDRLRTSSRSPSGRRATAARPRIRPVLGALRDDRPEGRCRPGGSRRRRARRRVSSPARAREDQLVAVRRAPQ